MGLFDSLFGGEDLEQAVKRHIVPGRPADKMIQSCISELVLVPMSSRTIDPAYLQELTQILLRYFDHPLTKDMISLCLMRSSMSMAVTFARLDDGTLGGKLVPWLDSSVPSVERTPGGISPKMDRLLRTRVLLNRSKGWILTSLYDDGTLMSPSIEGPAGPMGLGDGWKIDIPG
jgi:hypothetical protein